MKIGQNLPADVSERAGLERTFIFPNSDWNDNSKKPCIYAADFYKSC